LAGKPLEDYADKKIFFNEKISNLRIILILREPFDYTKWQRTLWPERSIEQISAAAMKARKEKEQ